MQVSSLQDTIHSKMKNSLKIKGLNKTLHAEE